MSELKVIKSIEAPKWFENKRKELDGFLDGVCVKYGLENPSVARKEFNNDGEKMIEFAVRMNEQMRKLSDKEKEIVKNAVNLHRTGISFFWAILRTEFILNDKFDFGVADHLNYKDGQIRIIDDSAVGCNCKEEVDKVGKMEKKDKEKFFPMIDDLIDVIDKVIKKYE